MDENGFWDIIDGARSSAKPFHQALADRLAAGSQQEILDYQERFCAVHQALYRWDIWAAAYLIGRGCSDDSFIDFRAGVVAQGRDWYVRVVNCPDSLADHPVMAASAGRWRNPLFYAEVNYVASRAFARLSGDGEAFYEALSARETGDREPPDWGEQFDIDDEDEIRRRLPRLSEACLGAPVPG